MIFGSENELADHEFLKTIFKMVTNLNNYVTVDDEDDNGFGYHYRDDMIAKFKQDIFNKSFDHQDQDECDDSLQKGIKFWLNYVVVNEGAPTPDNIHDYNFNDPGMDFFRGSRYDQELREI